MQAEGYDFDCSIFNNGNEIVVSMYIYIKKPVFTAEEYTRLKEFYRSYMKKAREYIIFKAAVNTLKLYYFSFVIIERR